MNNMNSENDHMKISKNYNLTQKEEITSINYINQLLKEFEIQLNLISLETTWYSIMPLGRKICQSMLELLLNKEGFFISDYIKFIEIIQFSFNNNIITQKYYRILNLIRIQSNIALHGDELKYGNCTNFLKELSEFINWINETLSNNDEKKFFVEEIKLKINSFLKTSHPNNQTIKPTKMHSSSLKYKFYKREESEDILEINNLLNDYSKHLKLISNEKKFYYAFLGSTITELMLKLLLKKEKLYNPQENYTFYQYIEILYYNKIIPKECNNFLHLIRRYRNEFVHGKEHSNKMIFSFLKALNNFIQWFDNYYTINYQNKFQIEECCEMINSLTYDEFNNKLIFIETKEKQKFKMDSELKIHESKTNKDISKLKNEIKSLNNEIKKKDISSEKCELRSPIIKEYYYNDIIEKLNEELKIKENIHQKQINELNGKNDALLKKLDEANRQLAICLDTLVEINKKENRIESKIDNLNLKIDNISNQIKIIQSVTERQINNAQSSEEIERIIGTYIDECVENIMSYSQNFTENKNYQIERKKLIYSIGEEGWNKLSEKSKTFLITSKVMYNHLITMDDIIDYSGICVLVTKAVEVEIHKRFFTNFLDYLYKKYGSNYKKYHTALLYQNRKPLLSEKFTMGNIAFVMCYTENWNDSDEQKTNNKLQLIEYCKTSVFSKYNEEEINKLLIKYATSIENIRKTYRNPSAHTNEIKRIDAEECFNLVLDIEKLLKQMLDSFDT